MSSFCSFCHEVYTVMEYPKDLLVLSMGDVTYNKEHCFINTSFKTVYGIWYTGTQVHGYTGTLVTALVPTYDRDGSPG